MKRHLLIMSLLWYTGILLTASLIPDDMPLPHVTYKLPQNADADWLIIGAGPAGIAVVGLLLDIGILPERIAWVDPEFNVGRMGAYYGHVPANNKTKDFVDFVNACKSFQECNCPALETLKQYDPQKFPELQVIIEPLKAITDYLCTKVQATKDMLTSLNFTDDVWHVGTQGGILISAQHVVLATGSHPRTLEYNNQSIIPLDIALDPNNLKPPLINTTDTVGVVGGSHSAILLLKFLSEIDIKHVYNFYKHPIVYSVDMGGWILNPYDGLKGITAEWARTVLEKNPPANLTRIKSTPEVLDRMLPTCDKVIYAMGFDRNQLPVINGSIPITDYNEKTGFIAPRLFGIGIAFPEKTCDKLGNPGYSIGLTSFMRYAQNIVPEWVHNEDVAQGRNKQIIEQIDLFRTMESLFSIYTL